MNVCIGWTGDTDNSPVNCFQIVQKYIRIGIKGKKFCSRGVRKCRLTDLGRGAPTTTTTRRRCEGGADVLSEGTATIVGRLYKVSHY